MVGPAGDEPGPVVDDGRRGISGSEPTLIADDGRRESSIRAAGLGGVVGLVVGRPVEDMLELIAGEDP
jgi:hypothetical protein